MSATDTAVEDEVVPAEAPAPVKKAKRSNVLPALIIAIGLVGGGFFMGSGGSDQAEDAPPDEADEEIVPGEIVTLEPMTLNLADGSYLRLGLAVELAESVLGKEWVEHGGASRYSDMIIARVGDLSSDQLTAEGGRDQLKDLLRKGGSELFDEEFSDVYLTEYIVQ